MSLGSSLEVGGPGPRRDLVLSRPVLPLAAPLGLAAALAPAGADLEWSAPTDCPPATSVEAGAAALLGRPLAEGPTARRVRARGTIAREPGGFRLDLEVRSDDRVDRRTLRDGRCQVLAEATALILATTVDPTLSTGEGPPPLPPETSRTWPDEPVSSSMLESTTSPGPAPPAAPAPIAPPPAAPDPLAAPAPAPPPPRPAPDRLRVGLRLSGVFDQGGLPGPTGGPGLAVGVLRRAWRVELGVGTLAPRVARPDPDLAPGARLSLWTASVRACGVAGPRRRLELAACGALEAGALLATGVGIIDARTRAQPWLAVVVGPELAFVPAPRLALTIGVDAVLPVLRALFTLDGVGTVFHGNPAAFRGIVGVQLRLL